jgi:hypothetical protein
MNIFISYRRKTWPFTQRLAEKLRMRLAAHVFVDTDSIDDDDFDDSILKHLRSSDVFVLVVSEQTFDPARINREGDWVRREIGEALGLDLPIILAMVDGCTPPPAEDLPIDIRDVATKQGIEFYPVYFEAGVEKLAQFIRKVLRQKKARLPMWAGVAGAVIVAGLIIGGLMARGAIWPDGTPTPTQQDTLTSAPPTEGPTEPATTAPTRSPAEEVKRNADWSPVIKTFGDMEMVLVPAGYFMMGDQNGQANEKPANQVYIEDPFWIGRTEVTNAQYGSEGAFAGDSRPRDSVSWFDASQYCARNGMRLPTEAEWEFAARGPDDLSYPWGNTFIIDYSVNSANSDDHTADVGSRPAGASWVGALDMSGNLWEWVSTIYVIYPYSENDGRENPNDLKSPRVLRGASWKNPVFDDGRTSFRFKDTPASASYYFGFRCARTWRPNE